jgi:PhzF family phenazine biosynthesis protein
VQVDVFTEVRYLGNPLGVVLDAEGLSDEEMQGITSWANLSETTFVLPPTDDGADYRVRIFSPMGELPFAGHPTLGSAHAWTAYSGCDKALLTQECGIGLVQLRRAPYGLSFAAPALIRGGPVDPSFVDHVATTLNLGPGAVVDAQWVDNGPGWVALVLQDADAVLALRPGLVDCVVGVVGFYPPGHDVAYEVRAFFPKDGATTEDPVTGSLNASLAGWLVGAGRVAAPYVAGQGSVLGRRGRVHIDQADDGGIWVGGGSVTCITGEIVA